MQCIDSHLEQKSSSHTWLVGGAEGAETAGEAEGLEFAPEEEADDVSVALTTTLVSLPTVKDGRVLKAGVDRGAFVPRTVEKDFVAVSFILRMTSQCT